MESTRYQPAQTTSATLRPTSHGGTGASPVSGRTGVSSSTRSSSSIPRHPQPRVPRPAPSGAESASEELSQIMVVQPVGAPDGPAVQGQKHRGQQDKPEHHQGAKDDGRHRRPLHTCSPRVSPCGQAGVGNPATGPLSGRCQRETPLGNSTAIFESLLALVSCSP